MKRIGFIFGIFFISALCFSQTKITYSGDSSYKMVERTNLRRYVNGKYSGLTSREVRSFISRSDVPLGTRSSKFDRWYDGNFFVTEETLRNSQAVMSGIHDAIPSVFKISPDGKMSMIEDNGYPTFRSFPSYTTEQLKKGDSWKGEGERAVDPMNKGVFTRIPILVLYTFEGSELYKGENVYRIKAIWQTNYGFSNSYRDPKGDESLKKATGGHKADIIVRASTGEAILINDNVDETFQYSDGTQVNLKGTITLFTEYPPAVDRDKLIFALNRIAKADIPKNKGEKIATAKGTGTSKDTKTNDSYKKNKKSSGDRGVSESGFPEIGGGAGAGETVATSKGTGNLNGKSKVETSVGDVSKGTSTGGGANSVREAIGLKDEKTGESDKNQKTEKMVFEETPAGLRLSVRDIKFKADSSDVLSTEKSRLDEIANVLKLAPDSQFLIEGHTAAVGKPSGEQKLSEERAKKIATELAKRGIAADKFICKGYGGTKPIADNSTDSGRAQNRRVEITILE